MLFTKDGDLYFQDGENTPVKLTHVGEKAPSPILSDDNKKVVFFREESGFSNIYSINADGSQEQTLVRNRAPLPVSPNQNNSQAFVPETHLLLFNTYACESQKEESLCATGLSRLNTDTGEIKELVTPDKPDQHNLGGNFKVSPDGKMVSVVAIGHLDLFSIDGRVIRRNILPYTPSTTYNLFPEQSWLPDSSGLIIGLPNTIYDSVAYGDVPAYTVWRYTIDNNIAVQIPLDPSPMFYEFHASPDGNWILYGGVAEYESSLYIGNLVDGETRFFDNAVYPHFSWSPSSKKFLFANKLGALDKPPATIGIINPLGWIDNTHFTYHELLVGIPDTDIQILVAEIKGEIIFTYDLGTSLPNLKVIKPK